MALQATNGKREERPNGRLLPGIMPGAPKEDEDEEVWLTERLHESLIPESKLPQWSKRPLRTDPATGLLFKYIKGKKIFVERKAKITVPKHKKK